MLISASGATSSSGAASGPILDTLSGSVEFAISTRRLRTAYAGSALRVRRSSDNAEQDVGFLAGGDLDTASMLSFVGANDGFITTWYDQTTAARHATASLSGNEPQIVDAGSLILMPNGKAGVRYPESATGVAPAVAYVGRNFFLVIETTDTAGVTISDHDSTSPYVGYFADGSGSSTFNGVTEDIVEVDGVLLSPATRDQLHTEIADGATHSLMVQNIPVRAHRWGTGYPGSAGFNANMLAPEFLVFSNIDTTNVALLRGDISAYWT